MEILLIHGAANSAGVWRLWQEELAGRGWPCQGVDLRGHGMAPPMDLSHVSMEDYAADVEATIAGLRDRPVLMGWSMGGLVAMIVAERGNAAGCICLAPSMPARSVDEAAPLREGVFGPEEYGILNSDPADQPAMTDLNLEERAIALQSLSWESRYARDQRARGVVINFLSCPLLLITGEADSQWPEERYRDLWLPAERVQVPGASHWGLVLSRTAVTWTAPAVCSWLGKL